MVDNLLKAVEVGPLGVRFLIKLGADTVLGLMFWSVESFFPEAIFAFPLFAMTLSGWEIFAFFPIVLLHLFHWRLKALNQGILMMIAVVACASTFYCTPVTRLPMLALSELALLTIISGRIWQQNSYSRKRTSIGLLLGLVVLLTLRLYFRSLNPVWVQQAYNTNLAVLGTAAAAIMGLTATRDQSISSSSSPTSPSYYYSNHQHYKSKPGWLKVGLGAGCVIFMLLWLATSPGIIARWVDLNPWPRSLMIPLAVCVGGVIGTCYLERAASVKVWAVGGVLPSILLCYGGGHLAYLGGVVLVGYCALVFPLAMERCSPCDPSKTLTAALMVRLLLCFVNVWIVAYKFVPLGFLLRERLDVNLFVPVLLIGYGMVRQQHKGKHQDNMRTKAESKFVKTIVVACAVLAVVCLLPVVVYRSSALMTATSKVPEGKFRGLIWTIHFGYDNNGKNNFDLLLDEVRRFDADIIGFLETDTNRIFTGNTDPVEYIGESLGYHTYYGPSTRTNTWGCALFSVYPIIRADPVVLPSPQGELACLIDADVNINGTIVTVFVTHFGNEEDTIDRRLQAETVAAMASQNRTRNHPIIFLGYFTMKPFSDNYKLFTEVGMLDSSPYTADRWCEYIWYRNLDLTAFSQIPQTLASDTEIQVAEFQFIPNYQ